MRRERVKEEVNLSEWLDAPTEYIQGHDGYGNEAAVGFKVDWEKALIQKVYDLEQRIKALEESRGEA